VILAHPDDPEFMVGGTIAHWVAAGWEVTYLLCTRGDAGSDDPAMTPDRLSGLRQHEQRDAAAALGVRQVLFLDYPDGQLQHTLELRREIARVVRQVRPDRAVCFDPSTRWYPDYVNHPDHYISGEAALAGIFPAARERLAFPELLAEGLEPHKVMEIWLTGSLQPDHWEDISDTLEAKIAAMCRHGSQVGDGTEVRAALERRAAAAGRLAPEPMAAAEDFRRIRMRR
jgi:LmbE family N-acetylglucosaminyl deacetylase